ncbi:25185_t:CDS:2, partial [Dentiscutata erythropus]
IDNCNHTRLVATALLEDETEKSFIWALYMISKCTSDLASRVVYMDFDPAIANAILTNMMVIDIFESRFESLKLKYIVAASYIKRQLEPFKTKWAICYINNQFTKIQDLLDREAKYACVEEYKHQILVVGPANILKTLFKSLNTIANKYLIEPVLIKVCKQMEEYFYYDTHLDDIVSDRVREDDYELVQSLLTNILRTIKCSEILEIWRITFLCGTKSQFVILISD